MCVVHEIYPWPRGIYFLWHRHKSILLLAAPTSLCGRCARHNSHPASSVMDVISCCSDGFHVLVDTVHPSLLRSSSFSSPRWYHLQSLSSNAFLVSSLCASKPHQPCFPEPLCDVLYRLSLPAVFVSHVVSQRVATCPSAHLHVCQLQFLRVGASDWHCLHPVQHSWLNYHCVDLSLN